ncbi:filamentous hemagglutinin N-terminal domain-containing protein, partial [Aliterella atlantica]
MTNIRCPSWKILTSGTIVSCLLLGWTNRVAAQNRPIADDTLGNERSTVVPLGGDTQGDRINGGARRGDNLFHSFQQFGVDVGRSVYFIDPGVNNIITRVTGGNSSQIDGTLGVLGGRANLFLINPSGIIFGANARLDLGGSFTATTASAIEFNNQGNFSATNPTAPPLLTVQPSAFLFNQLNPAPIANNSVLPTQTNPSGLPGFGLQVPNGKNLTLLGGDISINGGGINALGGRVEIGGLGAPGTINLNADGGLNFPIGVARADVLLANQGRIDVVADSGGSITINAGKLEILGSRLSAGIGRDSGFVSAQAGDITLNASTIVGEDRAVIRNQVGIGGIGNAGDIRISTGSLSLADGARIIALTVGKGNAGNVIIDARERVTFDRSYIFSTVGTTTSDATTVVGNGGDIRITTGSLSLTNGAQLAASAFAGKGDAGNVIINARDIVTIDGRDPIEPIYRSVISSTNGAINNANQIAVGNGGDIRITTGFLSLTNGAGLTANTIGKGNAGDVIINARERVALDNSDIFSAVGYAYANEFAVGNGGDIRITTGSFSLTNNALLSASTFGQGDAGNVIINARDRVALDNSAIFSTVSSTSANEFVVRNGGDIRITTGSLALTNRAGLSATTYGKGNAGNVIIDARNRVALDNSGIFSTIESDANGFAV